MRFGIMLIRIMLGISFLVHGIPKILDLNGTIEWITSLGAPAFLVVIVSFGEVIGGVALLLGILTPYVNVFYICVMMGSIIMLKWTRGYVGGIEFEFIHIVMNVAVLSSYKWKKFMQFY